MSTLRRALLFCALCMPGLTSAAELDTVRAGLLDDLQSAQRELSAAEATISAERGALAERLNAAQNRVLDLRERAVAARRVADEETLSLASIESRLREWRDQSVFQARLLAGFLESNGARVVNTDMSGMESDLAQFNSFLALQQQRLYPGWEPTQLVGANGQITDAATLRLGPVQWFWQPGSAQAGLTLSDEGLTRAALLFDGAALTGIADLYTASVGLATFDPTLTRVSLLAENDETLMEHLVKGGVWVIPIVLFALFATVIAALKALSLYRLPRLEPLLAERVEHALISGGNALQTLQKKLHGAQAEILTIALQTQNAEQRDENLHVALLEQRGKLERWLGAIALTASVSPLLGLLGTVSGMITTFKLMTLFGSGDPRTVSAGISEALITTELGLVVAIPAVLAHALMSRRVKSYFSQLENDAVRLSQLPQQAGA